jgi:hypothetical protein
MEINRERSTTEDRVIAYLIEWLCELTGKPAEEFEGKTAEELYELVAKENPRAESRPERRKLNELEENNNN